jgi:hypothetical protein
VGSEPTSYLTEYLVPSDGNCLFSSLSYFWRGICGYHKQLRTIIATMIEDKNMMQDYYFGDRRCIEAFTSIYNCKIIVFDFSNYSKEDGTTIHIFGEDKKNVITFFLYFNGSHYNPYYHPLFSSIM